MSCNSSVVFVSSCVDVMLFCSGVARCLDFTVVHSLESRMKRESKTPLIENKKKQNEFKTTKKKTKTYIKTPH